MPDKDVGQNDHAGRVAIITGGSDGIGRATAEMLARAGATVVVVARGAEKLEATRKAIEDAGGTVEAVQLDVSDLDAYAALIADVAKRHGRLDYLVNNAMSVQYMPLDKLTIEGWRKDFAVNADAVFIGTQAAMRAMREAGNGGSIVNISSTTGIRAAANMASYSASKAALTHFSAVAAIEGTDDNIRVNAIVPGQVNTIATQDFARMAPKVAAQTEAGIPMKRGGTAEELAGPIVFLLSDAASYITGVALPVDGGKAAQLYLPG